MSRMSTIATSGLPREVMISGVPLARRAYSTRDTRAVVISTLFKLDLLTADKHTITDLPPDRNDVHCPLGFILYIIV